MKAKVAIIGGGISGLSAARQLKERGFRCEVFDSGKRVVGGRSSTRDIDVSGFRYYADHSAQFFTAQASEFKYIVSDMISKNYVIPWEGPIGIIDQVGCFVDLPIEEKRFVGKDGITSVAKYMSYGLETKLDTWVSKIEKVHSGGWKLWKYGKLLGEFDFVIIAHNGKCADRLLWSANTPQIHKILKVNFGPSISRPSDMRKMQLCSLWVGIYAIRGSLPVPFEGAYVRSTILAWACNTTKKIRQSICENTGAEAKPGVESSVEPIEMWTLISTREFGAENKVPQENIPKEKEVEIAATLLSEFERCSGLIPDSVRSSVVFSKMQLWGAAVPLNRYMGAPAVMDGDDGVGVVGDWFQSSGVDDETGGPSIEAAFMSGFRLANHIADTLHGGEGRETGGGPRGPVRVASLGLGEGHFFQKCAFHPLGDVPSVGSSVEVAAKRERGPLLTTGAQELQSRQSKALVADSTKRAHVEGISQLPTAPKTTKTWRPSSGVSQRSSQHSAK